MIKFVNGLLLCIDMRKVSLIANDILRSKNTLLSINMHLINSWDDIVGDELAEFVRFRNSTYIGLNKINVSVSIISAAVLLFKASQTLIAEKIRNITNATAVNFSINHVTSYKNDSKKQRSSYKKDIVIEPKIDKTFKNTALKDALEKLRLEIYEAA